jgi:hypothetical protein
MIGDSLMEQAKQAATQLIPYLPRPSLYFVARRAGISMPSTTLFAAPDSLPIKDYPISAFDALGPIKSQELPEAWRAAYLDWKEVKERSAALRTAVRCWTRAKSKGTAMDLDNLDSGCAAILLLAEGSQTALGQMLFREAVKNPAGAYIAAHVNDLQGTELDQILEALCSESSDPAFLFWTGYQRPQYRDACFLLASVCDSLYGGLAAAHTNNREWFVNLVDQANTKLAAATTALILLPKLSFTQREGWIESVSRDPRWAYETARWSMGTWHGGRWLELRQRLRDAGTADNGRWWYHWTRDVGLDADIQRVTNADPLWLFEFVLDLGLHTLPAPMRNRLWRQLTVDRTNREALLLLRWCQTRYTL